jgi:protein SCO1
MLRHLTLALCLALAAGQALAHGGHDHPPAVELPAFDYPPPEPGTYRLPALKPAAGGNVLDEAGSALDLGALLDGRITLLGFVYTRCADVCPLSLMVFQELHEATLRDPDLAGRTQLINLSFDPAHDTPDVMADLSDALSADGGAPWRFLTTLDEADLQPILGAYDQPVARKADAEDVYGPIAHVLRVYLIDAERRVRNIYSVDFLDPRLMLADLRTLLLEVGQ